MALLYTPAGALGDQAPDFSLPGVDGRQYALADYASHAVLVVAFICNHCPYVQAIEQRLIVLARDLAGQGAALVGINSNDVVNYPEDSFDNMQRRAKANNYPFAYLFDESQQVARAYGAVCTPDFFVYDQSRCLRYRGRLDDSPRDATRVTRQELKEAVLALLAHKAIPEPQHPSMGCSIKWKEG
ncbi:MAG: thioredoxin family protein [Magnetococcales bacterium]|nr:thioredoxin family protein [Magnetococcales bacterium]